MKPLKSCSVFVLLSVLCAVPGRSFSQDSCASVYVNAVRNVSLETKDRSEGAFYFNLYCEKSGKTKSFTSSGEATFPIEGIPASISASGSFDEATLRQFCDLGSKSSYFQSSDLNFGNFVVTDALASFNECRNLELSDILLTHSENAPLGVIINGHPMTTDPLVINAFNFDPERLECTSTSFSADGSREKIDGSRRFNVTGDFAISCTRLPVERGSSRSFPFTAFTVSVDASSYTVRLRDDQILGFELASEAKAALDAIIAERNSRVAALEEQLRSVTQERDRVNVAFASVAPRIVMLVVGDHAGLWGQFPGVVVQPGPVADMMNNAKGVCGTERVASRIEPLTTGGGSSGFNYVVVTCMPPSP